MDMQEIAARMEIQDAILRFARGVDRGHADMIRSAYFDDAIDHHGAFHGTAAELAKFIIPDMDAAGMVGQHMINNQLIEFDGSDAANVETYWHTVHPESTGLIWAGGRYLDRFERRDGEWKIAARTVLLDWSRAADNAPPWSLAETLPQGKRHDEDPSRGFFSTLT